ncbi:autotransporter domain-containing protein [Lichenihabitans psoromatis]|uniref:autotransporter family protein n=1 Tax=Lichenihabitans psoromatis TaxID=2528642 RepID=UPI001035EDE6|nr:autotransporter domain-containing protein [Lichenihabitans psoromatis]
MRLMLTVSTAALAVATVGLSGGGAFAQAVNTSPSNANLLNLLAPFLSLNSTATGQATLQQNLNTTVSINNSASTAIRAQAISDKSLPGSISAAFPTAGTITLANGQSVTLGVADNLAGGLPLQAIQSNPGQPGTIAPIQNVGGYGNVLGANYQTGIRASTPTTGPLANTYKLLNSAYTFTSADLGVAKNYFANGAATNPSTTPAGYVPVAAVAPAGYTLPTFNGLPNTTNSVLDLAYGVTNKQPGQDVYGSSRPVQVAPTRINAFDPTALNGLATNPSFPSGHTTYAYTDSILLAMLTPSLYQSSLARAADYANDRIVLGVHYPLDIIASRALASYDLSQAFTNPLYINNATTTSGTAINLPTLFTGAQTELSSYLSTQCGAAVATCATSAANTANDPYVPSATTQATYQQRLTYGLPTLTFAQAPQEAAPAGGPDASILLAPIYGGSTTAAATIAPNGGINGQLQTSTINQILVNTETNALAAFYGTSLSYWTRIDLYTAAGYFSNVNGTLTMAAADRLTTPVTIGNGGTLYGNGATITGNVTANGGGTFGAGSATAAGTTTVNGNLVLAANSNLVSTVTPTGSSTVAVNGNAALNGNLRLAVVGNANPFTQFSAVTATGGVTGQFATVGSANTNVNTIASYNANAVTITLNRTDVNFGNQAATQNQARVGSAISNAAQTTTNATAGALVNAIYQNYQVSPAQGQAALDNVSGEGIAAAQGAAFQSSAAFASSISDEQNARRTETYAVVGASPYGVLPTGAQGYAPITKSPFPAIKAQVLPPVNPWHVWGGGFGGSSNIDASARLGTARQNDTFYGGQVGVDYRVQPNWLIGAAVGGSEADFNVPNRATNGTVTGVHGGLYSTYGFANSFYLQSSAVLSGFSNDTHRTAGGFGGLGAQRLNGSYDSFEVRLRGEVGKRFDYGTTGITPFVAVEYANLQSDGFSETSNAGVGTLGLNVRDRTTESLPVFVGARFDSIYAMGNGTVLRPYLTLAYVHEFSPTRNLVHSFLSLPNATFLVAGARPAEDAAQVKAGFEYGLRPGVALFANFDGEFSGISNTYAGQGGLRVSF